MRLRPAALLATLFVACGVLSGCHSAFVQATVQNHSGGTIQLFEVDYPSASFGGNELADGATFRYRFKVLGTGRTKLTWTDVSQHDHTVQGPELQEGEEGSLGITIEPSDAKWDTQLHGR